ncbi:hypothetical protein MJT46_018753 [Ovis ammon polii x Ovis aries]|nr:hypothetical protein MJT46_018753 [Ovis ammon polii x Ovis aries]
MTPPIGSTAVGPGVREGGALEQAWAWAWLAALQGILPWKHHSLASTSSLSLENPFLTMPSVGTKNQVGSFKTCPSALEQQPFPEVNNHGRCL